MRHRSSPRSVRARPRRWPLAVLAVAVAVAVWGIARSAGELDSASWARVERRDLVISIDVEGELEAASSADLGPPQAKSIWDFKISFLAPEGAEVAAGEPVVGFDTDSLQHLLRKMVAERDTAVKELEKRATDLEIDRRDQLMELAEAVAELRYAELELEVPEQVISRRELEQARIDHRLARFEVEHARAGLEYLAARGRADLARFAEKRDRAAARVAEIEEQIAAMTVEAPRAGTVIYKTDRRGEKKKVGDKVWRAGTVVRIPDLSSMLGEGEVAEVDAGLLRAGQRLALRLDAYPDRRYSATVEKIRRTVQRKSWYNPRKVVRLIVALEETDVERMRPGMRFRGEIETGRVAGTLVVPREAVVARPAGSAVVVRTLLGKREVFPTFGERNAELFEVTSGLEEGDEVMLRGGGPS